MAIESSESTTVRRCTDDAWKALASAVDLIKNMETKAAVTLASATTVGGLLFNLVKGQSFGSIPIVLSVCACAASVFAAGISAAMTLWPRLYTQDCVRSELFFGHIDQKFQTPREFVDQAHALLSNENRLTREVIGQFWSISCIARRKYWWSRLALVSVLTALANLAVTALIVSL